jgi:hypothetical protein
VVDMNKSKKDSLDCSSNAESLEHSNMNLSNSSATSFESVLRGEHVFAIFSANRNNYVFKELRNGVY